MVGGGGLGEGGGKEGEEGFEREGGVGRRRGEEHIRSFKAIHCASNL